MKSSKTLLTIVIATCIAIGILAMQKPITNALVENNPVLNLEISNTWDLPEELNEISGIAWLQGNTFACVQDEEGYIFIYDLDQEKITSKIKFAGPGDYEGIAVNGNDAYVMRSDGLVYEIQNYTSENRKVSEFKTPFSEDNNMESLTFDSKSNRLLTVPKDRDLNDDNVKGVYQISLDQKTMDKKPITKIDMNEEVFNSTKNKKIYKTFNPSEIAIHPKTNDFYILEGKNPKFIVLNSEGELQNLQPLDPKTFPQPEGMTFTDDGRLFISNEAKNGKATILEIGISK